MDLHAIRVERVSAPGGRRLTVACGKLPAVAFRTAQLRTAAAQPAGDVRIGQHERPGESRAGQVDALGGLERAAGQAAQTAAYEGQQRHLGIVEDDRKGAIEVAVLKAQRAQQLRRFQIQLPADPYPAQLHPLGVQSRARYDEQALQLCGLNRLVLPPALHHVSIEHGAISQRAQQVQRLACTGRSDHPGFERFPIVTLRRPAAGRQLILPRSCDCLRRRLRPPPGTGCGDRAPCLDLKSA